jgi:DENN domain-containing protein 5
VLSHYGFFNLFQYVLTQTYQLSLSQSALPLERHVLNLMEEVPLPPQGRVEVSFSLPQFALHVARPPRNQLPMVDFSYQPLFAMLHVDTVLVLFQALCHEMTICVCCSNVALLTPIQEGLLSLLFPFVWQGCYVPVLPDHLIELLDAPVPLLVGLHDSYLLDSTPESRPQNVLFVHVDRNELLFTEDSERRISSLLAISPAKSKLAKLRGKLVDYGSCVFSNNNNNNNNNTSWSRAGYPFPNNEHLVPIKSFLSEQGALSAVHQQHSVFSTAQLTSSLQKLGVRKASASNSPASSSSVSVSSSLARGKSVEAVPYRHPVACTVVFASNVATGPRSLLDPENNFDGSSAPNHFNAKEIREAFLRFFIASFKDYQDFLKARFNEHDPLFDTAGFVALTQDEFLSHL